MGTMEKTWWFLKPQKCRSYRNLWQFDGFFGCSELDLKRQVDRQASVLANKITEVRRKKGANVG